MLPSELPDGLTAFVSMHRRLFWSRMEQEGKDAIRVWLFKGYAGSPNRNQRIYQPC